MKPDRRDIGLPEMLPVVGPTEDVQNRNGFLIFKALSQEKQDLHVVVMHGSPSQVFTSTVTCSSFSKPTKRSL